MRKSITAIALASLVVLVVTASVAAADPFGWRAGGRTTDGNSSGYGSYGNSAGTGAYTNWDPVATAVPTASQPAATQPAATPRSPARLSASATPTHHHAEVRSSTGTRTTQRQSTQHQDRHGWDWCDGYGRDDHGSYWH